MTADAWMTLVVLTAMLAVLFGRRVGPASAMLAATAGLYVLGVTEVEEAFGGFASEAPWVIGGLYVIAGVVQRTGALAGALTAVIGAETSQRRSLVNLLVPAAGASALIANTPVVATLAPAIGRWCDTRGRSAASLLMPLSFATILGGTLTVIGSSTNVAASGLLRRSGHDRIEMFDLVVMSGPVVLLGLAFLVIASPIILRRDGSSAEDTTPLPHVARFPIGDDHRLLGTSIAALKAQLAGVDHVERPGATPANLSDTDELEAGDIVTVTGAVTAVIEAREAIHGHSTDSGALRYFEAVVAPGATFVGMELHDAAEHHMVFARRAGSTDDHAPIRRGDTVLVCADPIVVRDTSSTSEYSLVSRIDVPPTRPHLARRAVPIALATVIAASIPAIGVLRAVICGVGALVFAGTVRPREALRLVNLEVVVLIGAALGVGAAVETSGLASEMVVQLERLTSSTGNVAGVVIVLVATVIMTEMLTNVAAVAILLPVALRLAPELAVDERQLALAVVIAASASFLTPFGYQTNTMVWRPGGYSIGDFTRLGAPLTAIVITVLTLGVVV